MGSLKLWGTLFNKIRRNGGIKLRYGHRDSFKLNSSLVEEKFDSLG